MDNKTLKKGYVEFIGHSSIEVTGSAYLIRYLNYHIVVDYGMRQSSKDDEDYQINCKRHKDIHPRKLDAIVLTHAHLDHSGMIPALFKNGCDCPVFVPDGTKGLLTIMFQDCIKIFSTEEERYKRTPLFDQDDIDNTLSHIVECHTDKDIVINESISFRMYNAQHIVKARQVLFTCTDGVNTKRIGFTGDWSDYKESYFLTNRDKLPSCDILVAETTYSDNYRSHKIRDRKTDINKLDAAIKYAVENKSKVIIPTFSLHRLQTMLAVLYETYNGDAPIRILIDSPLGKNISALWDKLIDSDHELWNSIKNWDNVHWISDFKDSMHFNSIHEPMLILCGGGFLNGGRATYWVKENLDKKDNYIVFCGYSTSESPAGQIKSGKSKEIKIDGVRVKNKAKALTLNSFSSHADRKHLLEYYTYDVQYNKICLVHSEQNNKIKFGDELKAELSKANRSSRVIAAQKDGKVHF